MSDLTSAELRQAAEKLRERATAATPGPWRCHVSEFTSLGGDVAGVTDAGCSCDYSCNRTDPVYIATLDPNVGLILVDILIQAADTVDADGFHKNQPVDELARAINRSLA